MPVVDQLKNAARKILESKPTSESLAVALRPRKARVRHFADDGIVPNHPRWPVIIYRQILKLESFDQDPAAVIDTMFAANGWGRSWRDSIYDFVHYHSQIHEVLGVAKGAARLEVGGIKGAIYSLNPGDVVILPAGTGHRLISSDPDLIVVGAYPPEGRYDECTDTRDRHKSAASISDTPRPQSDPVYGEKGQLLSYWR